MGERRIVIGAVALLLLSGGDSRADERKKRPLGTVVVTATRAEQPIEQASYVGERKDFNRTFMIDDNDDHVVVDLALSYRISGPLRTMHGTEFFTRIGNLFDKQYEEAIGFEAPPINFLAGVRFLL